MMFDPDSLLTREELLQKIWAERLSPAHRAQCRAEATARGVTVMNLLREEAARHDAAMEDPIEREKWLRINRKMYQRDAMPLGRDPLFEKGGEP
jgi:hypothetical protein